MHFTLCTLHITLHYLHPVIHTVYINERPLIFFPVYDSGKLLKEEHFEKVSEHQAELLELVEKLEKKNAEGIFLLNEDPQKTWLRFCDQFDLVEAGGGVVLNKEQKILMIFRRGKWDLPKGKLDADETPETAAVREVEEETGVGELTILRPLETTFYLYTEKGKRKLKKTHWYLMNTSSDIQPQPQIEEDIQEVRWMSKDEVREKALKNTYVTICNIMVEFLKG